MSLAAAEHWSHGSWWVSGLFRSRQGKPRLFDERLRRMGAVVLSFAEHEIDEIKAEGRDMVHVETN